MNAESAPAEIYSLRSLGHRFDDLEVLSNITFSVAKGEIVGLVGPNGAGKTTLLRILCGLLRGWKGELDFMARPIRNWDRQAFARVVAYLPQQTRIAFPYTVREVVLMGRLPHQDGSFFESRADHARVEEVLDLTGCSHLASRYFQELSGGEQQLVSLASALAQDPSVLLLDEPTVFLDLRHQLQIYQILSRLQQANRTTLIIVTHDLGLAQSFCRRLLFLKQGKIRADLSSESGPIKIGPQLIEEVFDVKATVLDGASNSRIELRFGQ
jgi:iron complex transport system ATP-binding protein